MKKYSEYIGNATNNEAEYRAVIFALKKVKALLGKKNIEAAEIEIRSDSELLVRQLNGEYKILDSKIQPLFLEIWNLRIDFGKMKFSGKPCNRAASRGVNLLGFLFFCSIKISEPSL